MTKKPQVDARIRILTEGADLTSGDRNETYGNPVTNMQHFARLLTAYFSDLLHEGYEFSGEDAAHIMTLAKLSRTANRKADYHEDNYIDAAVYSAIAGECAEIER